ncbi:MAG: hypothetical protein PVH89_01760 [Gammaproteobacteria bacterium]|jgi:hypothetical protein
MRLRIFSLAGVVAALALAVPSLAQEGHPLKGSWIGVWEDNPTHDEFVLVILDWNGREITGMINPGTDNIEITHAELDPENWSVRIEADTEDASGRSVDYVIEGEIHDLELPNRYLTGSWRSSDGRGDFEIRRQ